MENYPNASNKKSPPPEKRVQKVVVGEVTRRQKSMGRRFADFFSPSDLRGVAGNVILTVLFPAARDALADSWRNFGDGIFYGNDAVRRGSSAARGTGSGGTQYFSYNKVAQAASDAPRDISRRARSQFNFDEIVLSSRVEGEEILQMMGNLIDEYGAARVADLYDMLDIKMDFTNGNWGWYSLAKAGVTRVSDGYLLNLPRPVPLD